MLTFHRRLVTPPPADPCPDPAATSRCALTATSSPTSAPAGPCLVAVNLGPTPPDGPCPGPIRPAGCWSPPAPEYLATVTKGVPALTEYDYVHGVILLRISNAATPE